MTGKDAPANGSRRNILVEIVVLISLVAAAVILETWLGPAHRLSDWAQAHTAGGTIEVFFILSALTVALFIFAARRWREANRELRRRRELDQALVDSEQKHRQLLENIPDVAWSIDSRGEYLFVSPKVEKMLGYPVETMLAGGTTFWVSVIHPDDFKTIKKSYDSFFQTGVPLDLEYRVRKSDGTWLWLREQTTLIYEHKGRKCADGVLSDISRIKAGELKLAGSEQRFRNLLENIPDVTYTADVKGGYTSCSPNSMRLWGYSPEEIMNSLDDLVHPDDWDRLDKAWRSFIKGGPPYDQEYRLRLKNGSYTWVRVHCTETYTRDGKLYADGVLSDINSRKQTELALMESEENFRAIAENANDGIVILDHNGRHLFANRRAAAIYGYTLDEFMTRTTGDIVRPDLAPRALQVLRKLIEEGPPGESFEVPAVAKDGRPIETEVAASATTWRGLSADMLVVRDITGRKREELALQEAEENFRAIAENANDGIAILDRDGRYLFANRRAAEIFGYTADELMHMTAHDIIHPDMRDVVLARIRARIDGDLPAQQFENLNVRKDGGLVETEVTASATTWRGQKADLVMVRDVTERKRVEKALRDSEERLRTVFEAAQDALWVKDLECRYTMVNGGFLRTFGFKREDVLGKKPEDIFGPIAASVNATDRLVLAGQMVKEDRIHEHEGRLLQHNIIQVPLRDETGKVTGLLGIARDISEHKRIERALRESDQWIRTIFESAQDAFWVKNDQLRYTNVNEALLRRLGLAREEMIGKRVVDVYGPKVAALVELCDQRVLAGETIQEERTYEYKGQVFNLSVIVAPVRDAEGRVRWLFGVSRDISAQKRVERALRDSEERLRTVFESAQDAFWVKDDQLRYTSVNDAMIQRIGLAREEIMGKTARDIYGTELGEMAERADRRVLAGETVREERTYEFRGSTVQVSVIMTPVRDVEGRVRGLFGVSRDISQAKKVEAALRESEENFRALAENANDGILIMDGEGRHLFVNQRLAEMLGFTVDEYVTKTLRETVHPDYYEKVAENVRRRVAGEIPAERYEAINLRKDGTSLMTEVMAARTFWRGQPADLVMLRDITERKKAEAALREAEENFRALAENATDGILILDAQGNYVYANPRAAAMTAYTVEELTNMNFRQRTPPEEHEKLADRLARTLRGEPIPAQQETILTRKDGGRVEIEISSSLTRWKGVPADLLILHDLAERKLAEKALRQSEENFRAVADNANDGIVVANAEGNHVYANERMSAITGYSVPELLKTNMRDLSHPSEHAKMSERLSARIAGRNMQPQCETVIVTKDRKAVSVEISSATSRWRGQPADLVIVRDITERKRAQQAIQEARDRAQRYLDVAGVMMLALDEKGKVTLINSKGCEILGCPEKEIVGKDWFDHFIPAKERIKMRSVFHTFMDGSVDFARSYENPIVTRSGGARFIAWRNSPLAGPDGKITGMLCSGDDVTDRREAEEALRRSEARYRAVVEDQQELIIRWNAELEITFANDAFCRYFAKSREELLGKTFMPLVPQEDHRRVEAYYAELGPANPVTTIEHRAITPGGAIRWQEWANRLLFNDKGEVVEGQSVGRDITERKYAEEALRQSEKSVRDIFETATTVSLIRIRPDGMDSTVEEFSSGAEQIFGYKREEMIGEPIGILYTPESFAGFAEALEAMTKTSKPVTRRLRMMRKNGEEFEALGSGCPVFDANGELAALIGIIVEIPDDGDADGPAAKRG